MSDTWSFKESLGDTIMEKYEALYVRLHEVFGKKNGPYVSPDWIICGKNVGVIFESSSTGYRPSGGSSFVEFGRVNDKFDVYIDKDLGDTIYVGSDKKVKRLLVTDWPE